MKKKPNRVASTGIGLRLKQWRKMARMKSMELAKLIKISQGSLSDIENNKSDPSANTMVNILTLTDIDWRWLLIGNFGDIERGTIPGNGKQPNIIHVSPGMEILVKGRDNV